MKSRPIQTLIYSKMKKALSLVTALLLLTSCATIFNESHTNITFYSTEAIQIVCKQDTLNTIDNKAILQVERKNEPLQLTVSTDSLSKTIEIEAKHSYRYWSNLIANGGIGMLVDKNTPKRYTYPHRIYINVTDTLISYSNYIQGKSKGELDLTLSLPHLNSFHLKPENEGAKTNTGFWGLNLGLDYYHSQRQFFTIGISWVSDFFVPLPAAVDLSGEYELMSSSYASFSNNHKLGRFSLGYGLAYTKNIWDFKYFDRFDPPPPTREAVKKSSIALGFIFPAYFQLGKHFNLGLIYRPTFYRPEMTDKFQYEHLISLDFAWKIRLRQ
ncbi:hypothetical protein [Croceimicrobium sp.]|uniref:hypothetical protein n=1 Tax=Croceimicrobium sp. TaxID=2828340 RepID=UPI003BABADEB